MKIRDLVFRQKENENVWYAEGIYEVTEIRKAFDGKFLIGENFKFDTLEEAIHNSNETNFMWLNWTMEILKNDWIEGDLDNNFKVKEITFDKDNENYYIGNGITTTYKIIKDYNDKFICEKFKIMSGEKSCDFVKHTNLENLIKSCNDENKELVNNVVRMVKDWILYDKSKNTMIKDFTIELSQFEDEIDFFDIIMKLPNRDIVYDSNYSCIGKVLNMSYHMNITDNQYFISMTVLFNSYIPASHNKYISFVPYYGGSRHGILFSYKKHR